MKSGRVLIVDNDTSYMSYLVREMKAKGAEVTGVESGEEAVRLVKENPQSCQFAVIDQFLGDRMSGIEATKELVDLNRTLYVLLFTNRPSDNPETIARFRHQAFSSGAYRYLERGSDEHATKRKIEDFVDEMEQLTRISEWVQDYYETRVALLPSLLTQLDVGIDVIDRSYKVWYMNRAMRAFTGVGEEELPRRFCSFCRGYRFVPCFNCIVEAVFDDSKLHDSIQLSPLPVRDKGRLFWRHVWAQPVQDRRGHPLLAADQRPLAVMEFVQDLTNTARLREMSPDSRLSVITNALYDHPIPEAYVRTRAFDRVRVFVRHPSDSSTFILKAAVGFSPALRIGTEMKANTSYHMSSAVANMQVSGFGFFFQEQGAVDPLSPDTARERFIYWPVIQGGETVALLEVIGRNCSKDTVDLLRPYAEQVQETIYQESSAVDSGHSTIEPLVAEVDRKIQAVTSPKQALRLLVSELCKLTNSHSAVLRYREQDDVVLLRLGLPEYMSYERVAMPRYKLSHAASWSVRTIVSGQEQLADVMHDHDLIAKRREYLSKAGYQVLHEAAALCFEPLLLEGKCIGSIGLHAITWDNYTKERVLVARAISRRIALALHDYLIAEQVAKDIEDAQDQTIRLLLHNMNTPLAIIQMEVESLSKDVAAGNLTQKAMREHIDMVGRQIKRIAQVRNEYLKLREPWGARIDQTDLHHLLRETAEGFRGQRDDVTLEYELSDQIHNVGVDRNALHQCLSLLLQNSLDALENKRGEKVITVRLRPASMDELALVTSPNPGLAIDVSDNGSGIPPDVAKDLFKVIRSGKAKGLGFGLGYCLHIATSAQGSVYYHPEYKHGAKFTLLLPFIPSTTKEDR